MKKLIILSVILAVFFSLISWQVHAQNPSAPAVTNANIKALNSDMADSGVAFIKFDGIDGECQEEQHFKWSYLESFDQLIKTLGPGGGRGRGTLTFEDIVVSKVLDKSSPKLAEALCKGKVFPRVMIEVGRPVGESGYQIFYAYELNSVQLTKYWIRGGKDDIPLSAPVEEISLNFEQIKVTYTEYDDAGNKKGTVQFTWNIPQNRS